MNAFCPPRHQCAETHRIEADLTATEVQQLREVVDALPCGAYATLIVKLSRALPMTSDFSMPRDERALDVMLDNLRAVRQ